MAPPLTSGEKLAAFFLTEKEAGLGREQRVTKRWPFPLRTTGPIA